MSTALTTKIPVKDRDGNTIADKEVATYAGLLAKAHEEGLKAITTRLLQIPGGDNGQTAIVEATVQTDKGTYAGLGDASPQNVNRRVASHLIRMAETRAKARALRDAVNIGMVALEELGGEEEVVPSRDERPQNVRSLPPRRETPQREAAQPAPDRRSFPTGNDPVRRAPPSDTRSDSQMTENQRRYLLRFLAERGFEGKAAIDALCKAADVQDVRQITKSTASALIDQWKQDGEGGGRAA